MIYLSLFRVALLCNTIQLSPVGFSEIDYVNNVVMGFWLQEVEVFY